MVEQDIVLVRGKDYWIAYSGITDGDFSYPRLWDLLGGWTGFSVLSGGHTALDRIGIRSGRQGQRWCTHFVHSISYIDMSQV